MKNILTLIICVHFFTMGFAQTDTISNNLYQNNGKIGIGISEPVYLLDIVGNAGQYDKKQFLTLTNLNDSMDVSLQLLSGNPLYPSKGTLGVVPYDYPVLPWLRGFTHLTSYSNGVAIRAHSWHGNIKFITGGNDPYFERMRIDSSGNVGIGTPAPQSKLQVANGDIYISDIEYGIIMKSPDGNCWRGVLDNEGQLKFYAITCPGDSIVMNTQQTKSPENILVYPNPASNTITVNLTNKQVNKPEYRIYNVSGQLQEKGRLRSDNQALDISGLPAGIYFINIYNNKGDRVYSRKIIKE
ncbi:MAG: T9SS type A sorting domain-containing protein [Lentimicrobium sp.]